MKRGTRIAQILAVLALALGARPARAQTSWDFFNPNVLQEIRLDIHPSDWLRLKATFTENTPYDCDLRWRFQGRDIAVTNIAIRSRGRDSRTPNKPSLRVDINRNEPNQLFLGLTSFILKNNTQDASLLHERLAQLYFSLMGIVAVREAHARLFVNDEYIGLYVLGEEIRRPMLLRVFGEDSGNLYEANWVRGDPFFWEFRGSDPALYFPHFFKPETNESNPQPGPIIDMLRTVNQASDADFQQAVGAYLNLNQIATQLGVEAFVADPDDLHENNFFLYRFLGSTRHQIIPWDKDGTFSNIEHDILRQRVNRLTQRLLAFPNLRNVYLQTLAKAAALAVGQNGWFARQIEQEYGIMRDAARADPNKMCIDPNTGTLKSCSNQEFEAAVEYLRQFARNRSSSVMRQLVTAGYELRVVNAASFVAEPVAPGSLISVFGENLAAATAQASSLPLPTTLGGVTVTIAGVTAPLLYVSPGQLNMQAPWGLSAGAAELVVTVNGVAASPIPVTVGAAAPGVFVVVHADGSLVTSQSPAAANEVVIVYANGLGAVNVQVPSGQASPLPAATTNQTPGVTIGGRAATVEFSGLTPGLVGLNQVNVRMPSELTAGPLTPLILNIGGQFAVPAFLATR